MQDIAFSLEASLVVGRLASHVHNTFDLLQATNAPDEQFLLIQNLLDDVVLSMQKLRKIYDDESVHWTPEARKYFRDGARIVYATAKAFLKTFGEGKFKLPDLPPETDEEFQN
jgi:hypothetical protein